MVRIRRPTSKSKVLVAKHSLIPVNDSRWLRRLDPPIPSRLKAHYFGMRVMPRAKDLGLRV